MSKTLIFCFGAIIGLALPLLIDFALFGKFTPCQTVTIYEDGSSIQKCSVRG